MLEIRIDLYSEADWRAWRAQHEAEFAGWRQQIVETVRSEGLTEPITGIRQTGGIVIDERNLHETISVQDMNSRKRGTLLCLDMEREHLPPGRRQNPKILGTEALTRVGRLLRGRFPYYLGTEYLPTEEKQRRHFPIQHLDLTDMPFERDMFDLFHSGDVFEHVPDVPKMLAEIARVLRPGGIAVSSFPFSPAQSTTRVKARQVAGQIEHLEPPEIDGNPARPSEGSLVFSMPGWDILDLCRACGFSDAKMIFLASSHYGVTSSSSSGMFVLAATKASKIAKQPSRAPRQILYAGPKLEQVIGLLALPRSGTTLLSSIMGVHSRVHSVFEPWNANKKVALPEAVTMSNFLDVFSVDTGGKPVLFIKETATYVDYIDKTHALLRSAPAAMKTRFNYLLRNPLHVFLSEFRAREVWWGGGKVEMSEEVFDRWAERTRIGLRRMFREGPTLNPLLISYEALVTNTDLVVRQLMEQLGLPFEGHQLHFETKTDGLIIRGDPKLASKPSRINPDSIEQRKAEFNQIEHVVSNSQHSGVIRAVADAFEEIGLRSIAPFNSSVARAAIGPLIEMV